MEWFGITKYGVTDPIKEMMNPKYVEPTEPKDLLELYEAGDKKKPFATLISDLDIYIGQADGYAYKSYDRLVKMRKKANFKPVGPWDIYKYPGCASMDYGWFLNDESLKNETWYKTYNRYA